MNVFKYTTLAIIAVYLIIELCSIVPLCSGSRIIAVYKENYPDSNAYIKGYKTEKGSVENFDVKVTPVTFWDRILLTDEDTNLLSNILKAAAGIAFAFYIYNLSYDNIFSKKGLNLFWLTLLLGVLSYVAFGLGTDHTRDFFTDLYIAKGGVGDTKYDFQAGLTRLDAIHNWGFYWIPLIIMNLYKTFSDHHEGKENSVWD